MVSGQDGCEYVTTDDERRYCMPRRSRAAASIVRLQPSTLTVAGAEREHAQNSSLRSTPQTDLFAVLVSTELMQSHEDTQPESPLDEPRAPPPPPRRQPRPLDVFPSTAE